MVANSLFYGALRCTDVMFDGVVCFYRGFGCYVFIVRWVKANNFPTSVLRFIFWRYGF